MNENIRAVREACRQLGLEVESPHPAGNLLRVRGGRGDRFFANWTTPFNPQSAARVCEDKAYAIALLSPHVRMPRTESFLDPDVRPQYRRYLGERTVEAIGARVRESFGVPVIVKRNRGSLGRNVFLCASEPEVVPAVQRVFDRRGPDYDYVCLAQEYVPHRHEFRVILVGGELALAYRKDPGAAAPEANLSPLHVPGSAARKVEDPALLAALADFCAPVRAVLGVEFCGVDVVRDGEGVLTCLEVNSSPGFDRYVASNGNADVVAVYRRALERLGS